MEIRELIEEQIKETKELIDSSNRGFLEILDQILANQCLMFRLFLGEEKNKNNNNETK